MPVDSGFGGIRAPEWGSGTGTGRAASPPGQPATPGPPYPESGAEIPNPGDRGGEYRPPMLGLAPGASRPGPSTPPPSEPQESRVSLNGVCILIASVSALDRRRLERALGETDASLHPVDDAEQARRLSAGRERECVLVIDAGLLDMPRDGQWRALRDRQGGLGFVVRCLVAPGAMRRVAENTFHVHPDDHAGLREAVRLLRDDRGPER